LKNTFTFLFILLFFSVSQANILDRLKNSSEMDQEKTEAVQDYETENFQGSEDDSLKPDGNTDDVPADSMSTTTTETVFESDRFDDLFNEAKIHFTNALIADHYGDSLEVQFQLRLCFESLSDIEVFNNLDAIQYDELQRFTARLISDFKELSPEADMLSEQFSVSDLRQDMEFLAEGYFDGIDSTTQVIEDRDGHIPIIINKRVERIINYFQDAGRDDFQEWLNRQPRYAALLLPIIREEGMPDELLYLSMIESGFKTNAYSYAKAMGLWQFIYATGKRYGLKRDYWIDERMDFEKSTRASMAYLRDLHTEFGDWYLALSAYNYGEGRIRRNIRWEGTRDYWKMRNMPRETRNYVPTFLAAAAISINPEKYGFTRPDSRTGLLSWDTLTIDKSIELETLARATGSSYDVLKELNPELRKHSTPNREYLVRIPPGTRDKLLAAYNSLEQAPTYQVHYVKRGETLTRISRKYGVSIRSIMSANKLHNKQPILIGQKLVIPVSEESLNALSGTGSSRPDYSGTHEKQLHVVRRGETLGHIAEKYQTRASHIRNWNKLRYNEYIYPDQKLVIWVPKSISGDGTYVVRSGDSLHIISQRTGVPLNTLQKLNPQIKGSLIYPGDVIRLNETN